MTSPLVPTVLLTRSGDRTDDLAVRLQALGVSAIQLPLIQQTGQTLPATALMAAPDALIFVSPAAATFGANQLPSAWRQLPRFAIGRATSLTLAQQGWPDTASPVQEDSEGMLRLSGLQDVNGKRVFIIRGDGGRDLLRETLQQRGATVKYLEVYRKLPVGPDRVQQLRHLATKPLLVVLTSAEALARLCAIIPVAQLKILTLVVASARIAELAAPRCDHVVTANGADSDALFAAIDRALRQRRH